ncbi:MAG TPA: ATP-binding cassette domain-containing protein, partial [Micromonosporaceae bacterium]
RVEPGEIVVLTGPNGAGKSTLLAALLGFVTPTDGSITGDATFAYVPQEPYLFAGTVSENIALGRPTAGPDEIAAAARTAALDIDLTTPVTDGGIGISAGQRRRVAIARAVLCPASVLLLDEPTAGLDECTEADVLDRLRRTGRTVIAVSHRPATIAAADRVVEVERRTVAAS